MTSIVYLVVGGVGGRYAQPKITHKGTKGVNLMAVVTIYTAEHSGELADYEIQAVVRVFLLDNARLGGRSLVRVFTLAQVQQVADIMGRLVQTGEHIEVYTSEQSGWDEGIEIEIVFRKNEYLFTYNPDGTIKDVEKQID